MSQSLSWGIIGTGAIAAIFAEGLTNSQTGKLVAVGSRTQAAADQFGATWQVPHCYASYEQLLADPQVQAVYISTPHPYHAEWAIKAAAAGKHILCEKPFALNYVEAEAMIAAARRHDVFLMEAFMYRCHPQIARLSELLQSAVIGQVRVIQSTFAFNAQFDPASRLYNSALAGGGIMDVGCYCVSGARLVAGIATGQAFADPEQLTAVAHIGETNVDEYALASLTFPGGILAQLFTGVHVHSEHVLRIFGSAGSILLPDPWTPAAAQSTHIIVKRDDEATARDILVENTAGLYSLEADTVATYLDQRQSPTMSWDDTLGNMRTLDRWRAAIGLRYPAEV